MFSLFLFFVLIIFVVVTYRRPIYGLATIVALLPSYLWRLHIWVLPTTFLELMILSLFVVWLIKDSRYKSLNLTFYYKNDNQIPKKLRYFLLAWLLVSIVSLLVNFSYGSLGLWRAYFLEPLMFFIMFVYLVKDKKDWQIILQALAILIAWLLTVSIYQNFSSWNFISAYNYPNPKRLTAVFSYPNALALLTAPISVFFFALWLQVKNKKKYIWYLLSALAGMSLSYLAMSQGALMAIILAVFIYLILAKKIRKISIPIFIVLFIFAGILFPVSAYINNFYQQIFNPGTGLNISSLEIRSWQWQETGQMLADNVFFGGGLNAYQSKMAPYHNIDWIEIYLYPHNIFLNFWTELGLGGLILFIVLLFLIVYQLKYLFKVKHLLSWPLTLFWLTWFVHGLVDVPYFKNDLSILFFIFLAITFSTYKSFGQSAETRK